MTANDTTRSDGQDSVEQVDHEKLLEQLQRLREAHLTAASEIGEIQEKIEANREQ